LTDAFVRQSRGEPVDSASLAQLVELDTTGVVERQRTAGIDVPNDGEQSRELLHVRAPSPDGLRRRE
jgi:hypothetical protein